MLEGRYRSSTGLGLGLLAARRLSDLFDAASEPGSTVIRLGKLLPRGTSADSETVARVSAALAQLAPHDPIAELREQNRELVRALDEVRERQTEVERLNQELAETNRGVMALYAELDEKAADLARASELKSRFLSNISHELRTPLNAILNISSLLLAHVDGPLAEEQDRQVGFIRSAATDLSEMVNDLLDLARIEAGRSVVRTSAFTAVDLFAALRGMFRALAASDAVAAGRRGAGRHPWTRDRRGQAVADPAQLHLQRPQVHRARRGPGVRADASPTAAMAFCGRGHRHRHRAGGPGAHLRGVPPARQRAPAPVDRARASACRSRAGWPSCWEGACRCRARRVRARCSA